MATRLTRRTAWLGGLAALATAGCSSSSPSSSSSAGRGTSPTPSGSPASSSPASPPASASPSRQQVELPTVTAWQPSDDDLQPACKVAAARHVESAGNGRGRALQVVDAQYGGLLTDSASVLVVTRAWRRSDGRIVAGGHTFDVRLSRAGARWRVTAVHPSRPGAARPPGPLARRVLAHDRIHLPPAATGDVRSGQVHPSVLRAMLSVAASYRIHVSVVRSGHPIYVFGTDRLSDHPQGRAFDTWLVDGRPVVSAPRSLVVDYMHAVTDAGSYNTGGPVLLGSAPQWFSDDTHHDHVHAGFAT